MLTRTSSAYAALLISPIELLTTNGRNGFALHLYEIVFPNEGKSRKIAGGGQVMPIVIVFLFVLTSDILGWEFPTNHIGMDIGDGTV